jgi:hypothetical protein
VICDAGQDEMLTEIGSSYNVPGVLPETGEEVDDEVDGSLPGLWVSEDE